MVYRFQDLWRWVAVGFVGTAAIFAVGVFAVQTLRAPDYIAEQPTGDATFTDPTVPKAPPQAGGAGELAPDRKSVLRPIVPERAIPPDTVTEDQQSTSTETTTAPANTTTTAPPSTTTTAPASTTTTAPPSTTTTAAPGIVTAIPPGQTAPTTEPEADIVIDLRPPADP